MGSDESSGNKNAKIPLEMWWGRAKKKGAERIPYIA